MSRTLAALLVVSFLCGCSRQKSQQVALLPEEVIKQAVEYGRLRASLTANELLEPWTVDLGYEQGKGRATIITPFVRVALLAWQAARKGQNVSEEVLRIALREQSGVVHFRVSLYGDEPNFCRKARFRLLFDGKSLEPISSYVPAYGDFTRDYYIVATGDVKFKGQDIPEKAQLQLEVVIPAVKEKSEIRIVFPFNLSAYR